MAKSASTAKKTSAKAKVGGKAKAGAPAPAPGPKTEAQKKAILEARIARAREAVRVVPSAAQVRELIAAAPDEKQPPIPIARLLSEAKQAAFNAENDLAQLCTRNYDFTNIGLIRALVAEVERLDLLASRPRPGKRTQAELTAEESGKEWRDQALDDIELAMKDDPDATEWLASVREGEGIDDLIDDAVRIADYVPGIASELENIGVDADEIAAEGRAYIERLTPHVHVRRAKQHSKSAVPERNRAALALHALVTRLYAFGKNVFRKQGNQARAYTSTYTRTRKAVYRAKQTREAKKVKGE
jgi:hypothetical protein